MDFSKLTKAERDAYQAESEQRPGESSEAHQARSMRLTNEAERKIAAVTEPEPQ